MTLNQAGLDLIDQPDGLYKNHRGKDFKGKCPQSVRDEIEAAIRSDIDVNGMKFVIKTGADVAGRGRGIDSRTKMLVRTVVP